MSKRDTQRAGGASPLSTLTRRRFGGLALAAALLAGTNRRALACPNPQSQIEAQWPELVMSLPLDAPRGHEHQLAGRVWAATRPWLENDIDACGFDANFRALQREIGQSEITCFGEVHDNPAHHMARARFLQAPLADSKPRAVVFEQIRADQQAALDSFAASNGTTDDLLEFLDWQHSAWARTADYKPLFEAAVSAKLPIYAGDPPRDVIHKAARQGLAAALLPDEIARLALDKPLGEANNAASLAEIEDSHCGMIPKSAHTGMAGAQRYRDAHMADALIRAADKHGSAILFAGNGHVRTDRGVPWYIRQRKPTLKIVSVMLVEVEDGKTDPEAYVPRDPVGKPATDYIVFTPRAERDDPCASMKAPPQR